MSDTPVPHLGAQPPEAEPQPQPLTPAGQGGQSAADADAGYQAYLAEKKAQQEEANRKAAGFSQEDLDAAVAAALARAGVNQNPGAELTEEEKAPARQLTPAEQGHFNNTGEILDTEDPHLTSHAPQ